MSEHAAIIQEDRSRVLCTECPWFKWDPSATRTQLREMHRQHVYASRER